MRFGIHARGFALMAAVVLIAMAAAAGGAPNPASAHFDYPVTGTVDDLVGANDATFNVFATRVRDDLDWMMDTHIVTDRMALRSILGARLALQVLSENEDSAALFTVTQVRDLEDKPAARLLAGFEIQALLEARVQTGREEGPAVARAYGRFLRADLGRLPWAVVGDTVKSSKAHDELMTTSLLVGGLNARIGPSLSQRHSLSIAQAMQILSARVYLRYLLPLRDETSAALADVSAGHSDVAQPEIWSQREVTLPAADRVTPVIVAIWDSGVDLAQFPGQTYTDPSPAAALDPHGLAFDMQGSPTHGDLQPLDAGRTAKYPEFAHELKGFSELQTAIGTPDSDALKHKFAGLKSADVGEETQSLAFFEEYVHGTHVAGIAARGNPAMRLAVARLTFDWRTTPDPPSEALAVRVAAEQMTFVRWFRDHHVRVVNMSWEMTEGGAVAALDRAGVVKTSQARFLLARRIFGIESAGLRKALESAPEILFVCAAGNSGGDTGSIKGIPSAFALPNLLVVGAVDGSGAETGFTNYGAAVKVDADGAQVDSVLPGGFRAKLSGTSMAAPNVVNLAAKLLALDPGLTPPQVIKLIADGATPSADGRLHNINPRRSVELLRGVKQASLN